MKGDPVTTSNFSWFEFWIPAFAGMTYVVQSKFSPKHFLYGLFIGFGILWGVIRSWPDEKLHIVFCDVGQGDAAYIRTPGGQEILVDGGPNNRVLGCLGKYMAFFDRSIDVVIATHPDKDHIGGVPEVLKRYKAKYLLMSPVKNKSLEFEQIIHETADNVPEVKYLMAGDSFRVDTIEFQLFWPGKDWYRDTTDGIEDIKTVSFANLPQFEATNQYSLLFLLKYHDFETLFTADADEVPQQLIKDAGLLELIPQNIDILKVPHHGSRTGLDQEFLDWVSPQYAVIQVGKNTYGHPHPELLNQLEKVKKVYRNDQHGAIEIVTDGEKYEIKVEKK